MTNQEKVSGDDLISSEEAAAILGIDEKTLLNWRGGLPDGPKGPRYQKLGKAVLYERRDVEQYAAGRREAKKT